MPERQEIAHAHGDARKSQHQGDHEIQGVLARYPGADDDVGGREPESDPEEQGDRR